MARPDLPPSPVPESRLEREVARERSEHSMNHDARVHLNVDEDERHKDARETSLSATVRR
jgi:hypothetical protein